MRAKRRRRRRVTVVTGTRAEYGLLRSTIAAIDVHPKLELQLVVTGMHLLRRFGLTVRDVEADRWRIDARVRMQRGDDGPLDQADGLARGVRGIAKFLVEAKSDIVLVLGDRIEALAGALVATTTGTFLAHIHGGDVAAGDADNLQRDSITKMAHIHLAATKKSATRIRRMGEASEHIHVVGAPGLDELLPYAQSRPNGAGDITLVVQHSCGRDIETEKQVMGSILRSVRGLPGETMVICPNSDRGHRGVLAAIDDEQRSRNGQSSMRVMKSVPRSTYLETLAGARMIVGNSSSGIIEAPALGVPSVNVGDRQAGRERGGDTVVDASEGYRSIRTAVSEAAVLKRRRRPITLYGAGGVGERIADILSSTLLDDSVRRKTV